MPSLNLQLWLGGLIFIRRATIRTKPVVEIARAISPSYVKAWVGNHRHPESRANLRQDTLMEIRKMIHIQKKLDQGALGMSDPLGPLQLALKPNSASSINRPLLNFYYCAHWSLIMGNTEAWKQLNWYSTNSDLTVPAEVICQDGGGYMPTRRRRLYAKTAEVICQLPIDTLRTQT